MIIRKYIKSGALALSAVTAMGFSSFGHGQVSSTKVIKMVVPYAAGGGTDILARQVAEALGPELGATIVVDNKAGASGNIGAMDVVRSAPDGNTLFMGDLALAVNPNLFKSMPFNPEKDLTPIAMVGTAPLVLVVGKQTNFKTVKDLEQQAKEKPGSITFASAGNGNPPHLAGELFKISTGTDIVHVPYKGDGPALNDLLGGHVSMLFTGISSTKQHIDSGTLTALAVTGKQRASTLPNVPTMAEAGYPDVNVTSWWAIFAPANLSSEMTESISSAVERAMKNPDLVQRFADRNIDVSYSNSEELKATLRTETDKWAKVLQAANIVAQ
ncbi:MAG: tripartite tricarboxylate transporter substrate binding protein [Lentimicrobiaceae bacterium]|nr:tripartite tricarboxylate transporter substrate binding protein [Lentimicrobiaceae bacterium]